MTAIYTYVWHASLFDTSLDFGGLWMGNAAKGGMEIYTPVHMDCMCYVSGCNLHGGYNMTLSMVSLGRALKMMQNGFEDNWNWLQYREDAFYVHVNVFRQLGGEGECFWN